jgi:hypothetical protein
VACEDDDKCRVRNWSWPILEIVSYPAFAWKDQTNPSAKRKKKPRSLVEVRTGYVPNTSLKRQLDKEKVK